MGGRRMEYLNLNECLRLLREGRVGRVAVTVHGVAHVVPVNYVVIERDVYFRTGSGSKLDAASVRQAASFEVDQLDGATETGWSVLVSGDLEVVVDEGRLDELDGLGLAPWAPGPMGFTVRLRTATVSGRRITT